MAANLSKLEVVQRFFSGTGFSYDQVATIFPEWRTVFNELPDFLRQTTWVSDSLAIMKENGFSDITSKSLTFGSSAIATARKT